MCVSLLSRPGLDLRSEAQEVSCLATAAEVKAKAVATVAMGVAEAVTAAEGVAKEVGVRDLVAKAG